MNEDKTYQLLVKRMQEISVVPPQTLGPFTTYYKMIVPFFKYKPLIATSIISFISSVILYFLLGATLVKIVSVLQFGF